MNSFLCGYVKKILMGQPCRNGRNNVFSIFIMVPYKHMDIYLRVAEESDLDRVLTYVRAYHEFEGIAHSAVNATSAVQPLLGRSTLGRVWLICRGSQPIGHIAICFGYSIEFCGRDAVVDEMYILPEHRGKGFGKAVLALVKSEATLLGVKALHLEVARSNESAQNLYKSAGFAPRERYFVMSVPLMVDVGHHLNGSNITRSSF